jgi:hypothetical protein
MPAAIPMPDEGRELIVIRDDRRYVGETKLKLPPGAQGNTDTLAVMAQIVREDSALPDLRNFAMREIIGAGKKTISSQIDAAFHFCRDKIVYRDEGEGTETVADLWSCIYGLNPDHPVGDCAIKSVALATVLSYLKLEPRFVAIRQVPNVDWFNHVFVEIGDEGEEITLDPTPENFEPGMTLGYYERLRYRIFH